MSSRGPNPLRFRALLEVLAEQAGRIADTRQEGKVRFELADCYRSAFAMFYLQDPSLLAFQRRFQERVQRNNLAGVFGVAQIPSDSQLRDLLDGHDPAPLEAVFAQYFRRLQRAKLLDAYRYLDGAYLLSMDGSEYFSSEALSCPQCLHAPSGGKGPTRYYHPILQATLVHPDSRQVIPLAPERVANRQGRSSQDSEFAAGLRMLKRIREAHPHLPLVVTADSLYAKQPFVEALGRARLSFILTAKPTDHPSLFADVEGLRRGALVDRLEWTDKRGKRHRLEWVNGLPLNANPKSPRVNFLEYWIEEPQGKVGYHSSWVTDIEISESNAALLMRGGRARWKIENETFNTLKNHGYHLEHNYGHGSRYLSQALFLLNLLAFFFHQIFQMADGLYRQARAGFTSRVEFWNAIRSAFRLLLFDGWDEVLARFTMEPSPAFGRPPPAPAR